ncbi:hypothetical protein [Sphingomonas segetis]|jgi:hypothetical protein|uniref:hypothetical protein n=1 Tax=Sphingomonas segetis TaxID=1104779 RepID=UPI0012D321F7|nr:hypothetical protein [Sphingomonas segetis]
MGVEPSLPVDVIVERRPWWESRACLALVVFATMVPLVYPPIPPLVDLFGHMGRYRVELDLDHSPWLQAYYDYHWAAIGNLGVDVLVIPLGKLLGLEWAVKVIVMAIPPLTAAGFLWVAREVHGRIPPTVFFALPFIYGFPFLFGFVNFALSVALAFLAFGLWLRLGRLERTVVREWLFVPISLVVFFTHTYGWGLLGLMCFSADAVRLHDRGRTWWRAGIEAALRTSVMGLPILIMLIWRSETHGGHTVDWFDWEIKWRWIYSALRDRWKWLDIASLIVPALVFLYALFSRKLTLSRNLAFSAIVLAAAFAIIPRIVFGSAYADMRLVPYVIAVALLAIRFRGAPDRTTAQVLAVIGLLFFGTRTVANTLSLGLAGRDQTAKLEAIDHLPRGARVISLVGMPCREYWPLLRNGHLGAMVIVRREGFSNDQWLLEGVNLLDLNYRAAGYYAADPSQLVRPNRCRDPLHRTIDQSLASLPRDDFDYVWLIDVPPHDAGLVTGLQPVWRGPGSILYRLH